MENQHKQIKGYRDLNRDEIDLMNQVKAKGAELGNLVAKIQSLPETDQHWAAMAKTDLQVGLMKLVRSIAKPTSF